MAKATVVWVARRWNANEYDLVGVFRTRGMAEAACYYAMMGASDRGFTYEVSAHAIDDPFYDGQRMEVKAP